MQPEPGEGKQEEPGEGKQQEPVEGKQQEPGEGKQQEPVEGMQQEPEGKGIGKSTEELGSGRRNGSLETHRGSTEEESQLRGVGAGKGRGKVKKG